MRGQKMLKFFSILMILVCLFGIAASAIGILDVFDEQKLIQSENDASEAKIADIEKNLAVLEAGKTAYEEGSEFLSENEAEYVTSKDAYNIGKTALDKRTSEFMKAKEAGTLNEATAAATQAELDTLNAQLERTKTSLDEYEAERAKVDAYEATKAQIENNLSALSEKDSVKTKVASGMDILSASKEALNEDSAQKNYALRMRFYINEAVAVIAILAFFAALLGLSSIKFPSVGKIRGGILLAFISFLAAAAACAYCVMNNYSTFIVLMAALAAEAVFAFLYIISLNQYKKTLLELIAD